MNTIRVMVDDGAEVVDRLDVVAVWDEARRVRQRRVRARYQEQAHRDARRRYVLRRVRALREWDEANRDD